MTTQQTTPQTARQIVETIIARHRSGIGAAGMPWESGDAGLGLALREVLDRLDLLEAVQETQRAYQLPPSDSPVQ